MSTPKRILDVGQCGFDGPRLGRFLTRQLHCMIDRAHTKAQALSLAAANAYDLVMVNRILDRDRTPGIDVIVALHAAHPTLRLMLISDLPEFQAQAEQLGAVKGFGKSALDSPETEELIRSLLV